MDTRDFEKRLETLGAFEISNKMLKLAQNNEKHNAFLNAGRGNPNWINTEARLAFARIVEFGVLESERTMHKETLAGYTTKENIGERFQKFLDDSKNSDLFLRRVIKYCVNELDIDEDDLVKELVDGAIGNNYPVPSRCLVNIEKILNAFLEKELYNKVPLSESTQVFPTEGGTAAICYIFNSLKENKLIKAGDKIAINTPIFTPYIQIPKLTDYEMVEINLSSTEENKWDIPLEELDKLYDESIKALFLVNPSNPGSKALGKEVLNKIKEIVEKRKDLIIITDDVYGTFVNGFQTVYSVVPYNTLLVYSFSKLYGATGWRIGLIALNKNNIFDDSIRNLSEKELKELDERYSIVTLKPGELPFIERLVADSRAVGLYHTSGLSTPQQVIMALFSLTALVNGEKDPYIETSKDIVGSRYHDLFSELGVIEDNDSTNAKYYSLIDIYKLAEELYNKNFANYLKTQFEEIDFLLKLAKEEGVVLMEGVGFSAVKGTLRVSQANLPDEAYKKIANRILELLKEYYVNYEGAK